MTEMQKLYKKETGKESFVGLDVDGNIEKPSAAIPQQSHTVGVAPKLQRNRKRISSLEKVKKTVNAHQKAAGYEGVLWRDIDDIGWAYFTIE